MKALEPDLPKRGQFQFRLRALLLLVVPAAFIAAIAAYWFAKAPMLAKPSEIYDSIDGNGLEFMFAKVAPPRSFAQTRCRGEGNPVGPKRGDWRRWFEGGLWSDAPTSDRALLAFRRFLSTMIQEKGGELRDQQELRDESRVTGFRFIYVVDDHAGTVEAYFGPETVHADSQVFRKLYVNIAEQTGFGPVDEFQFSPLEDDSPTEWKAKP